MRYALVEPDGRIAQIEDQPFEVHPSLIWVEIPPELDVNTRWTFDHQASEFVPEPLPEPEEPADEA